jgi:hypothetical protein
MLGQLEFAFLIVIACSVEVLFYKLWIPIFPVVVLRGHISSCLYVCGCDVWGLAKPLKQALYVGFISLTVSLLHKSIILCITTLIFYESMQDSSGLSAQF